MGGFHELGLAVVTSPFIHNHTVRGPHLTVSGQGYVAWLWVQEKEENTDFGE